MLSSVGVVGWYTWFFRDHQSGWNSSNLSGYFMDTLYSRPVAGDFLLNEVNPQMSRETAVLTGGNFPAGAVVSRAAATDPYGEVDDAHDDFAVNYDGVDATANDKNALLIVRLSVLKANHLAWPTAFTPAKIAAVISKMATQNLITR